MSRLFAYGRVSTQDQDTGNQIAEITRFGYEVLPHRWHSEKISAGVPAMSRPVFVEMLKKLEQGDTLIVAKLDRLGRDVIDVIATVEHLSKAGVNVVSLDLGKVELNTAAGKLQLTILAAVAAFEKQRIRERTMEGLANSDKKAGRPAVASVEEIQALKERGLSQSQVAKELDVSLSTVKRNWN